MTDILFNRERSGRRWFPWRLLRLNGAWKRDDGDFDAVPPQRDEPIDGGNDTPLPLRPTLGLALSSGGAKGLAHIGVIQVLEENDITIDAVAGSSMGAYVGALWAYGLDGHGLQRLASEMEQSRDLLGLIDPVLPPRRGFIRGARIESRLRSTMGDATFGEMKRPLSVVATELDGYRRVVFDSGDVPSAVRASLSIPGILEPCNRNGVEYIDGGVCDPLPVDVLLEKELDHIIAISVIPALADLPHDGREPMDPIDAGSRSWWRRCLSWLNRRVNYFARGNLFDILRSAAFGSQLRLAESSAERADVLIRPITHDCRWHDYTGWRNYIEIGRQAAEAALPEIRALLDSDGESDPSPARVHTNKHHHPPTARCA